MSDICKGCGNQLPAHASWCQQRIIREVTANPASFGDTDEVKQLRADAARVTEERDRLVAAQRAGWANGEWSIDQFRSSLPAPTFSSARPATDAAMLLGELDRMREALEAIRDDRCFVADGEPHELGDGCTCPQIRARTALAGGGR